MIFEATQGYHKFGLLFSPHLNMHVKRSMMLTFSYNQITFNISEYLLRVRQRYILY